MKTLVIISLVFCFINSQILQASQPIIKWNHKSLSKKITTINSLLQNPKKLVKSFKSKKNKALLIKALNQISKNSLPVFKPTGKQGFVIKSNNNSLFINPKLINKGHIQINKTLVDLRDIKNLHDLDKIINTRIAEKIGFSFSNLFFPVANADAVSGLAIFLGAVAIFAGGIALFSSSKKKNTTSISSKPSPPKPKPSTTPQASTPTKPQTDPTDTNLSAPKEFNLIFKQTKQVCGGCGMWFSSEGNNNNNPKLVIEYSINGSDKVKEIQHGKDGADNGFSVFISNGGRSGEKHNMLVKQGPHFTAFYRATLDEIPIKAKINKATLFLRLHAHEGLSNDDNGSIFVVHHCPKKWNWDHISWKHYDSGKNWDSPGGDYGEVIREIKAYDDIHKLGYGKHNPVIPFDFTNYVKKLFDQ